MAETNPGVSARVINVNPRRDANGVSYGPRRSFKVPGSGSALLGAPRGGIAVVNRDGEFKGIFGTVNKLFEMQADYTFDEIGTGYTLPAANNWAMMQYRDNVLLNNTFDGMKLFDSEVGGAVTAVPGAPKARIMFLAFECVFALDCDGDNRLMKNSAPGTYNNWLSAGAGNQEFPDGEALMGSGQLNDNTAAVLQRAAVHVLNLSGDSRIYTKIKVADGIGAVNPECIVQAPGALYFWDSSGCYRISAAGLEAIGRDKVNKSFMDALGEDGLNTIEGAYDPERKQVAWRYKSQAAPSDTVFDNIIVFDEVTKEFAEVHERTSALVKMSSPALALEDLDQFGSIDSLAFSLDSSVWKGDRPRLGALDANHMFGFFEGGFLPASIDTATLINPKSMLITSCLPVTDAADVTVSMGVRSRLADAVAWKLPRKMQASGRVPTKARGKALTARADIASSDWSFIRGIDDLVVSEGAGR
ncbi:hypothetical protein N8D56_05015 [Devosia sp. A8/3-2]|nr:hypothetical protein N8D56_05015 [Devosia sp. A8/3-2]